ncbi:ADP-ribose glycohydrolase MACROD1 isoform X2 [Pleurodeles waltl]|uniref:ADP-ribose glycohydrolase MACROD1 isoform X2 n=1 Tax=Pleurodeles waltl TaxID=8319 RepID=UPI003709B136
MLFRDLSVRIPALPMSPHWVLAAVCRGLSVRSLLRGARQVRVTDYSTARPKGSIRDVTGTARVGNSCKSLFSALFVEAGVSRASAFHLGSSAAVMAGKGGRGDLSGMGWKDARAYLKGLSSKQRQELYSMKDFIRLKQIPTWKDAFKSAKMKPSAEVKYPKDKHLIDKISLFRGDITKLEVDAIVNAANSSLLGGGGVDGCIHQAAGALLKEECSTLNGCETGKAKITCGYLLPAKHVIHTVGPVAQGDPSPTQEGELSNCYKNSLKLLLENKLRTVAFPCISTGVYGYPNAAAADVALNTIRLWLEENKDKVDRIIICVFLEKDEEIYLKKMAEYFPTA